MREISPHSLDVCVDIRTSEVIYLKVNVELKEETPVPALKYKNTHKSYFYP